MQSVKNEVFKCQVPDNWTVESGTYYLGNKFHPVAFVIHVEDDVHREVLTEAISLSVAIAGICKTYIGGEYMIINLLANPNIRYLISFGKDSIFSIKKILKAIHEGKVKDDKVYLSDGKVHYLAAIWKRGGELINRFRNQIELIDIPYPRIGHEECEKCVFKDKCIVQRVRIGSINNIKLPLFTHAVKSKLVETIEYYVNSGRVGKVEVVYTEPKLRIILCMKYVKDIVRAVIQSCIQEEPIEIELIVDKDECLKYVVYDKGAFDTKPYIVKFTDLLFEGVELELGKAYSLRLSPYLYVVVADNFASAYREVLRLFMKYAWIEPSSYGDRLNLMNVIVHILNIEDDTIPPEAPTSRERVKQYAEMQFQGVKPEGAYYAYGERMIFKGREFIENVGVEVPIVNQYRKILAMLKARFRLKKQDFDAEKGAIVMFYEYIDGIDDYVAKELGLPKATSTKEPCLTLLQIMLSKEPVEPLKRSDKPFYKVHGVLYIRSHDFLRADPENVAFAREVILRLCQDLKREFPEFNFTPGTLTVFIASNQIYLEEMNRLRHIIQKIGS